MNRLHLKKIFSGIVLVSILTVTGTLSSLICPAETVRASDTLSNPKITDDSSLYAGKKVTWDCVWLGSYPQSEVTAENGQIYEKLKAADDSQWDENGDITIGNYKYRRLCRSQTDVILSILVDTFISKISLTMQPGPKIDSISGA